MYCGHKLKDGGLVGIVCGPMKSGKSNELISLVRKLQCQDQVDFHVYKSIIDNRKSVEVVDSRDGVDITCTPIADPYQLLTEKTHLYLLDEAQFFPKTIVPVVEELLWRQKHIILFGLDLDFRGEPFGAMPELLSMADYVKKLTAYCDVCGDIGRRTQRLINGEPAPYDSPLIAVGDKDLYEVRCKHHHIVPEKT